MRFIWMTRPALSQVRPDQVQTSPGEEALTGNQGELSAAKAVMDPEAEAVERVASRMERSPQNWRARPTPVEEEPVEEERKSFVAVERKGLQVEQ